MSRIWEGIKTRRGTGQRRRKNLVRTKTFPCEHGEGDTHFLIHRKSTRSRSTRKREQIAVRMKQNRVVQVRSRIRVLFVTENEQNVRDFPIIDRLLITGINTGKLQIMNDINITLLIFYY